MKMKMLFSCASLLLIMLVSTTNLQAQSLQETYTAGSEVCLKRYNFDTGKTFWEYGVYIGVVNHTSLSGTTEFRHSVKSGDFTVYMGDSLIEPCCEKCRGGTTSGANGNTTNGTSGSSTSGTSGSTTSGTSGNSTNGTSGSATSSTTKKKKQDEKSGDEVYYRVDNLTNPRFTKLDQEKAKSFIESVDNKFKENAKLKRKVIFPKNFKVADMDYEVYAIKFRYDTDFQRTMMTTNYVDNKMMDPEDNGYSPLRAGSINTQRSGLPQYGDELKGGQRDGFIILKAKNMDASNPPKKLKDWVRNNLNGIFDYDTPKLKLGIASNNELSICLEMDKIHTYKEKNGKLIKVRSLDGEDDLVAFTRGKNNKYCIITTKGKADNTTMHSFNGAMDRMQTKNLKLWDKHPQDMLNEKPYPTFDYANGEYLFQYYTTMWDDKLNRYLHSASFRLKIKDDGSMKPRKWQTSHTFGMDAIHNGTDWVSLYSTDGDYFLNHPGIFIDKFDKSQKALLFSSPHRWAERGTPDADHGRMNYFYTGLGGLAYDGSGYGVVFNNPNIKKAPTQLPQNVGFVYVKGNYSSTPRRSNGDISPIDPTKNLTNYGTKEDVIIHTERMNTEPVSYKRKVKWLSHYKSKANGFSKNPDIVAIGDKFIVVWEKWINAEEAKDKWGRMIPVWDLAGIEARVINSKGKVLESKFLGKYSLNDCDDLHIQNGKVVWSTFDDASFSVHLHTLDVNLNHEVKVLSLP